MGRPFSGTNANTIANGARSNEAFISLINQDSFFPFKGTIFHNNSLAPNEVDLLVRFDGSDNVTLFLGVGATIVDDRPFRFVIVENLDGANTLQANAFRFTTESTRL